MMALKKCETGIKCMDCPLFPDTNHFMMTVGLIFKNIIEDLKFAIISSQWESLVRPYQHDLKVR